MSIVRRCAREIVADDYVAVFLNQVVPNCPTYWLPHDSDPLGTPLPMLAKGMTPGWLSYR